MTYYTQDGGVPTLGGTGGHKHDLEIVIVEIGRGVSEVVLASYCALR